MTKFEKAFSAAYRAGKSTFVYNGKVYSTARKNQQPTRQQKTTNSQQRSSNNRYNGYGALRRDKSIFVEDFDDFLQNTQAQYERAQKAKQQQRRVGDGVLRNDRVKNKEAIIQHKVANNVTDPYVIIDKPNNTMDIYRGDQLLESHEIGLGQIQGDGYYQLSPNQPTQYWQMPRTTPAGIFTLNATDHSPYMGNEPMYYLMNDGVNTRVAMHSPAGPNRVSVLGNPSTTDNRVSYGCVSPNLGVMRHLYDDKVINTGDTAYVIPEMPGNYIARQGNYQLRTVYGGETPSTFMSPDGFIGPITYNDSW